MQQPLYLKDVAQREFHVSREARDRYKFEETLFTLNGNLIFANFHAARVFAQKMNAQRDLVNHPEKTVYAGQINAMGLIDEISHYVMRLYREQREPTVLQEALDYLEDTVGSQALDEALTIFTETFPPIAVYRQELTAREYLASETNGVSHRQIALEELLMLWLANLNLAFAPYQELFDDTPLQQTSYPEIMDTLYDFFDQQPTFGPDNQNLIDMLRAPAKHSPDSLEGQLDYIRKRWATLLGEYFYRLLSSLDFLAEEGKMFFGFGPGPVKPYEFGGQELEIENFSPDLDWMPHLVLLAKNVYVWMDQLSKQYKHSITHLDEIPDEELDQLAHWGFTGLWLIGLWQRSQASKQIKQMMGNPEAVASAYSLDDYRIADDLGGEAAFENLKSRLWQRGIRISSDMVPNHMGIDSHWVIEHPDWFLSSDYAPFPTYTFNGPNLCADSRAEIYLEDHYYSRSDAAVVFKHVDHRDGRTRYIYHGNDGTSMPWNDTAQLNYLKPEVREAVIQTILQVARRSPVIRFDAAMTLTKKHYQRLWFPEPGTGGDIPSRAERGLNKEEFNAAMPEEFWREVVDRVAQEAPDTLLLAEAFWLMEGYFVRTLGMHRVYNSAFMNMMRDEKNAEYRQLIKNTLEFDPQILKRYVNFMNNPDERTAVDQFGKGDKYFGICTVMATMPGLPMVGHGQIEGYTEKYGMEYRRAYWDEQPDSHLVKRHERQVFPLFHKRYLFAEVDNFLLYDFFTPEGHVDENVFTYSNKSQNERSLVVYHNKYAETQGWIRSSVAYVVKGPNGEKTLVQKSLSEGLELASDPERYLVFRDAVTGLEYIRNCQEICEQGLYAQLHAYQIHVFVDLHEIQDDAYHRYARINQHLNGRGVPDLHEAIQELILEPVHSPYRMLVSAPAVKWLEEERAKRPGEPIDATVLEEVEQKMVDLLRAIKANLQVEEGDEKAIAQEVCAQLETALALPTVCAQLQAEKSKKLGTALAYVLGPQEEKATVIWGTYLSWLFTYALGKMADSEDFASFSRSWIDEWLLGKIIGQTLQGLGQSESQAHHTLMLIKFLVEHYEKLKLLYTDGEAYTLLKATLHTQELRTYLGINQYEDVLWFNREAFEQLLWWIAYLATIDILTTEREKSQEQITRLYACIQDLLEAEATSGFQVGKLLDAVAKPSAKQVE